MLTKKILISLIAFILGACTGNDSVSELVKVQQGLIKGVGENDLMVFKGIPFAKPPVGDLRWRPPQPTENWEDVKVTKDFAPDPVQGWGEPSSQSEDCLYLNVWTPAKTKGDKVPVLVWIYGGGFNGGATSVPGYDGTNLAKKGVILVSIAYRVGYIGFFAHPELTAESANNVSGNYGLLDMIAGLQWVQRNIDAFGGDPNKVTIFGESAGGIAVSMLCASPLAKGLFQGAISQSGGSFGPTRPTTYPGENMKTLAASEINGKGFLTKAGVSSIKELRQMSADSLVRGGYGKGLAWPIVDGYVIPDDQYKLYEEGKFNDTPILVGYNSDEGASFMRMTKPEEYFESVQERFGKYSDDLIKAYPVDKNSLPKTARDLMRDAAFGWHTWSWAKLQSRNGKSKAYYYYFDQHPEYAEDSPQAGYGSPHGQEVAYVFNNLDSNNSQLTKTDFEISDAMATYWTNFTKTGDPNGKGVPDWPSFNEGSPEVMYFSQKPYLGTVPSSESLEIMDKYFKWRRSPEGKAWAK
ncbi:MAG: carboxylesterase family protein [Melioribacteraceae bacterium]|nr:carboxylesterase family protein [Melioribacteraceae bacterium]